MTVLVLAFAGLGLAGALAATSLASSRLAGLTASAVAGTSSLGLGGETPPPGEEILFTRAASSFARRSLYLINPDGTGVRLFVSGAEAAAVSRDGQWIAFVRGGEIWMMRRDGSGQVRVTRPQGGWTDAGDPAWSPDGKTLYFFRDAKPVDKGSAIFSVAIDGSGLRRLTRLRCDYRPTASADGHFVVFGRILGDCIHGDSGAVRVVTTATARVVRRLPFRFPSLWLYDPAWSPDERQLAYTVINADALNGGPTGPSRMCCGLYLSGLDGSRPRRLLGRDFFVFGPAWSPDGTQLAFELFGNDGDIWLIGSDGSQLRRLTQTKADDSQAVWLPAQTPP